MRSIIAGLLVLAATVAVVATPQGPDPAPSIDVTLDRQAACYLELGDALFDVHLFFTAKYKNTSDRDEIFFDDEQAGVVLLAQPADALGDGWEFMPPRAEEPADRTHRFVVQPGETSSRPAHVTLTVRGPNVPAAAWPLGPGRYFFRVLVRRMRAATGDERRDFSAFGFWREYLSPPVEIDLVGPEPGRLCRDAFGPSVASLDDVRQR